MAITPRDSALLVGGLVLGLAGAWALFARGDRSEPAATVATAGSQRSAAANAAPEPTISADLCAFDRTLPRAGEADGQVALESDVSGKGAQDVRDLLVKGKEASAAGHRRDAETAFLMACRAGGRLSGENRILLADAMYRLGRHYAMVEPTAPEAKRGDLRQRARDLYATSLQAYRTQYGDDHEKTRFASTGLASLGGTAAQVKAKTPRTEPAAVAPTPAPARVAEAPKPPAVVTAPKVVPTPAPAPVRSAAPAAPEPGREPQVAVRRDPPPSPRQAERASAAEPLPAAAEGEASIGQATGDAGDVSQ